MSLNISGNIMEFSSEVRVTIDTTKFGPRQIKVMHESVRTGLCVGNGVPTRVARVIRRKHGAPVLAVGRYVEWHGVNANNDAFFDKMTAAVVADQLLNPAQNADSHWMHNAKKQVDAALQQRLPNGNFYFYDREFPKVLRSIVKGFDFEIKVPVTPRFIDIIVWDGKTEVYI